MRDALLAYLCCPTCRGDLDLEAFEAERGDVVEGLLSCGGCASAFPVVDGIPDMLPNALVEHRAFARRHAGRIAAARGGDPDAARIRGFERLHRRTASAFGYEWNTYAVTRREEDLLTLYALTGIDPELHHRLPLADVFVHDPTDEEIRALDHSFLEGKTVLEVGCGMGKYLKVVSETASTTIGLDLSHSLLRARREIGDRPDVHLVRGNILEPPLRAGCVDFGYSVGVLHHTPDCHEAFRQSLSLVRPGGHFAVWLYPSERETSRYARTVHFVQDDVVRPITSRMPHALLYQLCRGLGAMGRWRDAAARAGHRRRAQLWSLLAVGAHPDPEIAAFLNFDWYSPQYRSYHTEDELLRWYREAGYTDVRVLPQRTSAIGRRLREGERPETAEPPRVEANLERPAADEGVATAGEWLEVGGWAFEYGGRSPIVRVLVDGVPRAVTECAHARLDVKAAFPKVAHAVYTGFLTRVRIPRGAAGASIRLEVTIETRDHPEPLASITRTLRVEARPARERWARRGARLVPARVRRRLARSAWARALAGRPPLGGIPDVEYRAWLRAREPGADQSGSEDAPRGPRPRVEVVALSRSAEASPSPLPAADFLLLVDADARLAEGARETLERALAEAPDTDLAYADFDHLDARGHRGRPHLLPGWSPELLLSRPYTGPLLVVRRTLFEAVGGLREGLPGAELYDLALRLAERTDRCLRVPRVLAHRSRDRRRERDAVRSEARAAQEALDRRGIAAVRHRGRAGTLRHGRLEWRGGPAPRVSIVVPSRDRIDLLDRCLRTLEARTRYAAYEVVVVDDRSREATTREYLARLPHRVVRAPERDRFNFSALINLGASEARGELLLFLNDDTEITEPDWLDEMVGYATIPGVGVVGALLLYPDGRIQHDGVVLGHEGLTGHAFQPDDARAAGYLALDRAPRNVAAVTGACLLTPASLFRRLGGLDEEHLAVGWNDVDYCLRARAAGQRIVVNPRARLVHHESATRSDDKDPAEVRTMLARWGPLIADDPYYHPAFDRSGPTYRLARDPQGTRTLYYARFLAADAPAEDPRPSPAGDGRRPPGGNMAGQVKASPEPLGSCDH